ncbi:restriction endonuclease subunit S [Sulfurovum sp. TSL1]|uniref:restriction endonuclease subunit S n=1 Tax=Sulfurovum sp. TSL1 TaxID=2826994 RepID=UPI001CC67653|nr:restriction endonuclease subunit S [Sulfurovum sp. TSL1]GIT98807.1 hypothetical protein TSL1_16280 [Sulfurovum sp. TSL1]
MSNVPQLRFKEFGSEWEEILLDKIAVFSKGKGVSKADLAEDGKTECIRYGELYSQYNELIQDVVSKTNVDKEDLVLSEYGDIIIPASGEAQIDIATASCVLKDNVALGGDLNIIKTKEDGVFLSYYLNNAKKIDIARLSQGISVVHLYSSQLKTLKLNIPSKPEQKKISSFFTSVDTRIEQLTKKEELLQQYKKGVMQKIFSQEIRFKADDGSEFPEWEEKKLNELMFEHKERNYEQKFDKNDVLSVSGTYGIVNQIEFQGRSFAGASVDNYHIVEVNDIVYTKSPLKSNPYGIIKVNQYKAGIVSTLYAVYRPKENLLSEYLGFYFQLDDNVNRYLRPLVHKGAKNDMKINNSYAISDSITIPSKQEQTKIANFLSSIDFKIEQVQKQLDATKAFKKGLFQQMFV